jgi:CO/xanthine dehydrogenase Mo-binding subunit
MSEGIGARVTRKEDKRFITGKGKYTDDVRLHGMTYASFVRSPHARKSKVLMSTLPRPCLAWWMY